MKIAITATQPSLEAKVDPRFGRCPYFIILETDTMDFEAAENPNAALGGGAGIQSAQLIAEKAVRFVLTGNCGPNAYQTLSAAGIGVIVGCSGTVAEVVEQFKAGQLNAAGEPNVGSKFGIGGTAGPGGAGPEAPQQSPPGGGSGAGGGMGMGRGMGGGMGRGMGRGMGGGMGRGMGGGMGRGMGGGAAMGPSAAPTPQQPQYLSKEEELAALKQHVEAMNRQMAQIQDRIRQLEQEG